MLPKIISSTIRKLVLTFFILSGLISSCKTAPPSTPASGKVEPPQTTVAGVFTPTPQVTESTSVPTSVNDTVQIFSSDEMGLCFSYPEGYTQLPYDDTVEIVGPELPGSDRRGLFWLEKNDAYDRTAEQIADEDMTYAVTQQGVPLENLGRWNVTLGGKEAVVLDGMPGQDLQRRVYVVHDQTLYILAFMPTRSDNKAAVDQMEALNAAVMNSWAWSPCSGRE